MIDYLKFKIACGVLLVMVGIGFLVSDFIIDMREVTFNRVNIELNDLLMADAHDVVNEDVEEVDENTEEVTDLVSDENQYETFAGFLEIPKINFSKGFYKKESKLNDVKFNLKILDVSNYPGDKNGNVIIIGHSGNYSNSYFANLYKLVINDTASIRYHDKKYIYKIVNIYNVLKDGSVTIYRDNTKNCLTLITCTKDDDTKQTVYIFEQIGVE